MTTLYVNYGGAGHYATQQLRHLLLQDFGCFGPVRSIHIVPAKTIAFVRCVCQVTEMVVPLQQDACACMRLTQGLGFIA
jgi:hypothetical protein